MVVDENWKTKKIVQNREDIKYWILITIETGWKNTVEQKALSLYKRN